MSEQPQAAVAPVEPAKKPRRRRRLLLWILLLLLLPPVALAYVGYATVRASLPILDGEVVIAGPRNAIRIERDALGVPTIHAESKADLAFGLGFVHAQERFFQMDLLRRSAAGELSDLLGPGDNDMLVNVDRDRRVHRFRARAQKAFAQLTPEEKNYLESYVQGVNLGLGKLGGKPFEYMLLGTEPEPWKAEDSFLLVAAMYLSLQPMIWHKESTLAAVTDLYPEPVAQWLGHPSDSWDAPVEGGAFPAPPMPTPDQFDLRREGAAPPRPTAKKSPDVHAWEEDVTLGSNNWAVAGNRSKVGAILCNDMHLELRLPNIWFRACLVWPDDRDPEKNRRAVGVTLPGGPVLVVGSNGYVAWGFTNSQADWADLILLESGGSADPNVYQTPEGPRLYDLIPETIKVRGRPDVPVNVLETIWGPVFDGDHQKRQRVLRWAAHDPECLNLRMGDLLDARTLEEAMAIANRCGSPHQNFMCADASGQIGWTILGRVPKRIGFDGRIPRSWADGSARWDGYIAPEETPRIVNPPEGFLWTANARVVDGEELALLGIGDYDRGARAGQIRDGLRSVPEADYDAMLAIHNDDRALFLERWQKLLLETLTDDVTAGNAGRSAYRNQVANWGGRAAVDSVGFRLVFDFRQRVQEKALTPLIARCQTGNKAYDPRLLPQPEGPLWQLVATKPVHLLHPRYQDWNALLLEAIDEQLAALAPHDPDLTKSTWGAANTAKIRHPLADALGFGGRWLLEAPADPLAGAPRDLPRIVAPAVGASQRIAVSPGREEEGYFHMPGGQSGHPLSPYFLAGHEAWVRGEKSPLLPGETRHVLTLVPEQP